MPKTKRTLQRKVPVRWLRRWHRAVVREVGTDDIARLIAGAKALRSYEQFRSMLISSLGAYPRLQNELKHALDSQFLKLPTWKS